MGSRHEVLKTIYEGAIQPLLLYGAPVWADTVKYAYNRRIYIRAQRMINLRIAKAFRTTSNEALCIVANTTPITLKIEEAVKIYTLRKNKINHAHTIDREVELNLLTPNDLYISRTTPITSKRCILYISSTNVGTEYFKHALYSPFFSLQNAVCFIMLTSLAPVLFTFYIQGVLKLKK